MRAFAVQQEVGDVSPDVQDDASTRFPSSCSTDPNSFLLLRDTARMSPAVDKVQ